MKKLRTPLIKPRPQGGTFYTFGSALEDIGLNINELNDTVAMSHYILLDLPETSEIQGEDFNIAFAESLQNYALNLETVVRNQTTYNFAEKRTVSERIFWKWLFKNYSPLNTLDPSTGDSAYKYITSGSDNCIIKGFGAITSGAQRTDAYGIYNETYIQIPSSYGQMPVLFKEINDYNYRSGQVFNPSSIDVIENIDSSTEVYNNKIIATGLSSVPIFDENEQYIIGENYDNLCVDFSLDNLRTYYNNESLTYDDLATNPEYSPRSDFKFNAILIYYSIYNSIGNVISTNAYGILILNNAIEGTSVFPEIEKRASNSGSIGNSYAFRLNIKPTSTYSANVTVNDNSTGGYEMSTEFNDVIRNLGRIIDVLKSNNNVIKTLVSQNATLKELLTQALDKIDSLEETINGRNGIKARLEVLENEDNA